MVGAVQLKENHSSHRLIIHHSAKPPYLLGGFSRRPSIRPHSKKCWAGSAPASFTSGFASSYAIGSKSAGTATDSFNAPTFCCSLDGLITPLSPHVEQMPSGSPDRRSRRRLRASIPCKMCARVWLTRLPTGLRTQQRLTPPSPLISTYTQGSRQSRVIPSGINRL